MAAPTSSRGPSSAVVLALTVGATPGVRAADPLASSTRPSPVAACNAWREHIAVLIDQHRIAQDIGENDLFNIVRRFIAARDACTPGRYEIGLRMYEAIPLGRVQATFPK